MCAVCDQWETERQRRRQSGELTKGWYLGALLNLNQQTIAARALSMMQAFPALGRADVPASFFEDLESHFLTLAQMAGDAKEARVEAGESFL